MESPIPSVVAAHKQLPWVGLAVAKDRQTLLPGPAYSTPFFISFSLSRCIFFSGGN